MRRRRSLLHEAVLFLHVRFKPQEFALLQVFELRAQLFANWAGLCKRINVLIVKSQVDLWVRISNPSANKLSMLPADIA
jgi:hypothetical protein